MIAAKDVLLVLLGAAGLEAGRRTYNYASSRNEADEEDDIDAEMREVYLKKGPTGLRRWLMTNEEAEDRDEAYELVEEFEEDNEDVVRKYKRRKERRKAAAEAREAEEKAKSKSSSRQAAAA